MARTLFSSAWYRVADFRPRLRPHTAIHRHVFRGHVWHVLQDHQTGRFHRLSPIANLMLCLMDGRRTMRDIWEAAGQRVRNDPPTQDEAIHLLSQLHSSDLLQGEIPPDFTEMAERSERAETRQLMMRLKNPLALRIPLFDPNRMLDATLPIIRPLFTWFGFAAWLALIVTGFVLAVLHWPELTTNVADRVLATENVALILFVYPVVKSLHELGHAYATKVWGGEVHEIGIMLLVFIPVLYVDASASAAFAQKRRRVVVGAAGILVEMALAAIAIFVWLYGSPGLARAVAFNVMLIGGVSTLLFNGNPLLRFDGYYIFSDLLEIPNLATRANGYFFYLVQKHLFKIRDIESPILAPGEAKWLFAYAVLSCVYRMFVSFGIALFLSTRMFIVGVVMALWALASIAIFPVFKGLRYLATNARLRGQRRRAITIVGGAFAVVAGLLFAVPLPYATIVEGVVIVPDQAEVRAKTEGFISAVLTRPGADAPARQPLVAVEDPTLDARIAVLEAQLEETRYRLDAVRQVDRVQVEMFEEQAGHLAERLEALRGRKRDLIVNSELAGQFVMPRADDMIGRYVKRGELLGYVIASGNPMVRVLAPQSDVDLIRQQTTRVEARLVEDPVRPIEARVSREVPAAQQDVPSLALTTRGGGTIALDPSKSQRPQTLFSQFQLDVELIDPPRKRTQGSRVYVRFLHGDEALAWRGLRALRQFFLGQFRV